MNKSNQINRNNISNKSSHSNDLSQSSTNRAAFRDVFSTTTKFSANASERDNLIAELEKKLKKANDDCSDLQVELAVRQKEMEFASKTEIENREKTMLQRVCSSFHS